MDIMASQSEEIKRGCCHSINNKSLLLRDIRLVDLFMPLIRVRFPCGLLLAILLAHGLISGLYNPM